MSLEANIRQHYHFLNSLPRRNFILVVLNVITADTREIPSYEMLCEDLSYKETNFRSICLQSDLGHSQPGTGSVFVNEMKFFGERFQDVNPLV